MSGVGGGVELRDAFSADEKAEVPPPRTLLTLAVLDYGDGDEEFTDGIREQLDVVTAWWSAEGSSTAFHQVPNPVLETRDDVEDFFRERKVRELGGQALVLFVTGHGLAGASRSHYLKLPGSVKNRKLATAVRTADVVAAALDSHAENVLVIVNACYAGQLASELTALYADIGQQRRETCRLDVLVTCGHDRPVQVRRFPTLLRGALHRLRTNAGVTTPHLSVGDFMAEFERGLRRGPERERHRLRQLVHSSSPLEPTPCIPNPGYRHDRESTGPGSAHGGGNTKDGYWLDRATGRTQDGDSGWYFRGRERLNRTLTTHLDGTRARGVLLVTGSAGSGKSAVLARAVVLSDPAYRNQPLCKAATEQVPAATVPPPGSVDAAVLARHQDASQVAAALLRALGETPAVPESAEDPVTCWSRQLVTHLRGRTGRVGVVLDGLDESEEADRIVSDVLGPLGEFCTARLPSQARGERRAAGERGAPRAAGEPGTPEAPGPADAAEGGSGGPGPAELSLLLGVRSSRPAAAAPADTCLDAQRGLLDLLRETFPSAEVERTDDEQSTADIAEYVTALLGDRSHPRAAHEAAALVARQVWPSFIDARLAGEQLKGDADPVHTVRQPEWQQMLGLGVRGLLRRDLALVAEEGLPADVAHALLRAAAFAEGSGVPWSVIWPAMAQTLLGRPLENWDEMIEKLLGSRLNGYLTHDHQDERRVYRPTHESLTEVLRAGTLLDDGGIA
ncbi:AAA family ATPase [Streptomyces sp. NPDC006784]|uniref:AAA family ATPase n=1 Tax=Streptomyces sp. NPDC006784 TaxID=3364764 RepID=UPI00368E5CAD